MTIRLEPVKSPKRLIASARLLKRCMIGSGLICLVICLLPLETMPRSYRWHHSALLVSLVVCLTCSALVFLRSVVVRDKVFAAICFVLAAYVMTTLLVSFLVYV